MSGAPAPRLRFGLPRDERLRSPADYRRVRLQGRTLDLGALVFQVAPRAVEDAARPTSPGPAPAVAALPGRLGLAISRRVGGAVVRNRVKRLVREAFRHRRERLAGLDVVASGRPAAAQLQSSSVERLFDTLLQRLGRGS